MTKFTDTQGNTIVLCDHCRTDMPLNTPAFTLSPGKVADSYISRDYDKGEMVICPVCASNIGKVLNLMGVKYADSLIALQAAA